MPLLKITPDKYSFPFLSTGTYCHYSCCVLFLFIMPESLRKEQQQFITNMQHILIIKIKQEAESNLLPPPTPNNKNPCPHNHTTKIINSSSTHYTYITAHLTPILSLSPLTPNCHLRDTGRNKNPRNIGVKRCIPTAMSVTTRITVAYGQQYTPFSYFTNCGGQSH